jgi:hypothetical protein
MDNYKKTHAQQFFPSGAATGTTPSPAPAIMSLLITSPGRRERAEEIGVVDLS